VHLLLGARTFLGGEKMGGVTFKIETREGSMHKESQQVRQDANRLPMSLRLAKDIVALKGK
jgi:hypothetical protein